ncbi:Golgi phosphoprotein 3 GPP34 [Mumia flava]|uniref:Golgi phosphoprotein 3 GPP34 n=1 Tax=Mumia flava TaxID=1348852 RepID=A0A0B2BI94_9ACTN|nr:GPP34 family phosphoprotein [Mumia flava]PJJ57956.1 Golgi phosphoprotein 3 GPP34 [Mumia flava]
MLIAEDVALLALDRDSGRVVADEVEVRHALAGALLLDLARAGVVRLEGTSVIAAGDVSPIHPLHRFAWCLIAAEVPLEVRDAIRHMAPTLTETVLGSLAERGVVRRADRRRVFRSSVCWHVDDPAGLDALRAETGRPVAAEARTAASGCDLQTAAVLTALAGSGLLGLVAPPPTPATAETYDRAAAAIAVGAGDLLPLCRAIHAGLGRSLHPAEIGSATSSSAAASA